MAEYMGYEGLGKSQRVGVRGAARLAEDHGYEYEIFDDGKIKIITPDGSRTFGANVKAGALGKFFGYAEGGMVKPVAKQMELFEEGGLLDEGGTVDEESGNDVPTGSLKKEVRDDIPAQLSEGEFVMPADVVRYHGLDKMMALRDEAKMGLQRMEAMGQMGNADEAIIPDGVPFTLIDLEIVDDEDEPMEMQVGGFVPGIPQQPPYGVVQQPPGQNIYSVPSQFQQPVAIPFQQPYFIPTQSPVMPVFGPGQPTGEPKETFTFDEMMPTVGGTSETREYRNAAGESLYIPFINGEPIYPIPEGYFPYTPEATPDPDQTQTATTQVSQQQEPDGPTREERIAEKEKNDRIRARKAAAKELGYTKEASAIGQMAKLFMPGASLIAGKEEAGTIMPDGSIADGAGNTFDPITGEQIGGRGFLGLGKEDFPTTEGARKLGVTPASQAGLMNIESEKSLDEFRKPVTDTTQVGTTQVTKEPTTTVTEATKTEYKGIGTDPLTGDVIPPLDFVTATNIIEKGSPEQMFAALSKENPDLPIARALADLRAQASGQYSNYDEGDVQVAKSALKYFEEEGRIPKADVKPAVTTPTQTAEEFRRDEARRAGMPFMSSSEARKTDIEDKINRAKSSDPSQYAKDVRAGVYDDDFSALDKVRAEVRLEENSKTNKVGTNIRDEYGDDIASKVRDDQGTVGSVDTDTGDIYYDNSHDWSKSTQNNVRNNPPAKAEEESDSRDDKIVCTEMYRQTQLDDWKQAIKIWGVHQKKYLTPYHEKGYHWLFKPWVRGMRKSVILTAVGAYLARARTQHLKYVLTHGKAKDNIVGNIWCKIVHPLTYITGRMLSWQKK